MKKRIAIALASVLVYLLLLLGLTTAEGAAGGSIRTLGDALWYSLVTMSTVGYGDLAPITPAGRLIGALFVLLSLGVLAFLLGMALTLLTGRGLPAFAWLWRASAAGMCFPNAVQPLRRWRTASPAHIPTP